MMYVKFCLIQGAYCIGWAGIMQAYLVPLCSDYGYSVLQISILTAIANAAAIVAKPVYGFLCDRIKRTALILSIATIVGIAAALLLLASRGVVALTAVAILILYGTTGALGYLIDAWTVRLQIAGVRLSYGETRACGSICYALFSGVFGNLLDRLGFGILVPMYIGMSVILLVSVLWVKEPIFMAEITNKKKQLPISEIRGLLMQRRFVGVLLSVFFVFFSSYCASLFLPLRIDEMGGSNTHYGMALFVSGTTEVIMLLLYRKLSIKFSHQKLLLASFVFALIMVVTLALSSKPRFAVVMMGMQGISSGLYLAAIAYFVPEVVGLSLSYTGSMIVAAMLSVAAVLAGLYMGVMITWIGLQMAMITGIAFGVLGIAEFLCLCCSK